MFIVVAMVCWTGGAWVASIKMGWRVEWGWKASDSFDEVWDVVVSKSIRHNCCWWARNYRHLWLCELSRAYACTRYLCCHRRPPTGWNFSKLITTHVTRIPKSLQISLKSSLHRRFSCDFAVWWSFCWYLEASYCLWFRYWIVSCSRSLFGVDDDSKCQKTSHVNVIVHVSHLSHSLYITVGYRRWLWTSLTSPLVILAMISSAGSCRIARLCAQQLSSRINVSRLLNFFAIILRLLAVLTFCFSIIYKFRRLLLFRRWNCVPAAALDDRRLIWLVTVVRRWPRRRCHSSVVEFPPRWRRWVKWDRLKASLNVWRLRRWFWRPHRQRRWIRLFDCRCVAARVLGTIALGPNAYKRSNEKWN